MRRLLLLLGLVAAPACGPNDHAEQGAAGPAKSTVVVPAGNVRAAHIASRQSEALSQPAYHVGVDGVLAAKNPAQHFSTRFDSNGFALTADSGAWEASFRTLGVRCDGRRIEINGAQPTRANEPNRVTADRSAGDTRFTEWYVNGPLGIEQGFTVPKDPCRGDAKELTFEIGVRGLRPQGNGAVALLDDRGAVRARYSDAFATDADGKDLAVALSSAGSNIELRVPVEGVRWPLVVDPIVATLETELAPTTNGEGAPSDVFGYSVSVSGNTAAIGAPYDSVGPKTQQGSVYIYVRSGATWSLQTKLLAGNGESYDRFGSSVSLSGDTLVVGAPGDTVGPNDRQGSTYVYLRSGTTWSQQAQLVASDGAASHEFGTSVSVEGNALVVGAPVIGTGRAYVYTRSGTTWTEQPKIIPADGVLSDHFGESVSISGSTVVVGARFHGVGGNAAQGSAYVYVQSGPSWVEQAKLHASDGASNDWNGFSVAIDGDTVLVGAMNAALSGIQRGATYVYVRNVTTWTEQAKLTASSGTSGDGFGRSVALSGNTAVVGLNPNGLGLPTVHVFVRSGTTWAQQPALIPNDATTKESKGTAVAIDGDTVIAGAWGGFTDQTGVAYAFFRSGSTWTEQSRFETGEGAQDAAFGSAVSISGATLVVGARSRTVGAVTNRGAASVYARSGTTWTKQAELAPSAGVQDLFFGYAVCVDGDTAVIGAPGIAGANIPGEVYVYVRSGTTWTEQQMFSASDGIADDAFGYSVAIYGDTVLVGATELDAGQKGAAYVFVRTGNTWTERKKIVAADGVANDLFGWSVSIYGGTMLIGAPGVTVGANTGQGAAYVFVGSGSTWTQQKKLVASDGAGGDTLGFAVSLSAETAVAGAPYKSSGRGGAYVYLRSGTTWGETKVSATDGAAGDNFGASVSLSGNTALIGADRDTGASGQQGSAYVYLRSGTTWTEQPKILAGDAANGAYFGNAVSVSADRAVVGAPSMNGAAPLGNPSEGRAYVYRLPGAPGGSCSVNGDCDSGFCVSNTCCDTACAGACDECAVAKGAEIDGVCGIVPAGSSGTPICAPQACNGASASCVACATDGDCTPDHYCSASGACQSRKAQAAACNAAAGADCKTAGCRVCASAGGCVDGFCCNAACGAACDTCAAASGAPSNGTCGNATAGTSGSTGACAAPYVCDGSSSSCPSACTSDAGCAAGNYCNAAGACVKQLVVGANCDTAPGGFCKAAGCRVCGSVGGCVNSVCCNAVCDGGCEICSGATAGVCTPKAVNAGCGTGYVCNGTSGACPTSCTSSAECAAGYYCDAGSGQCALKKTDGSPCATGAECENTYCADGFCCDTACGGCSACAAALKENGLANGVCGNAKENSDPHSACQAETQSGCGQTGECNGKGTCQFFVDVIAPCGPTTCSGNKVTGKVCTSQYLCGDSTQGLDCGQLKCTGGQCAPCVTSADCLDPSNYFCDAGDCKARRTQGAVCSDSAECASTFCVDGVCCETACNGQCEWCGDSAAPGVCKAAPKGPPEGSRAACTGTGACAGACDGAKRDGCVFPGNATTCGAASCNNDSLVPASTCDGTGACAPGTPQDCGGYTCDSAAGACKTSCATKADCRLGAVCDTTTGTGTCNASGAACSGAYSVKATDGTVSFCNGYRCVSNACQQQCATSTDCAPGYSCSANACVVSDSGAAGTGGAASSGGAAGSSGASSTGGAPGTGGDAAGGADGGLVTAGASGSPTAAAADEGGCACRVPARKSSDGPAGAAVLALGLFVVGRRRRSGARGEKIAVRPSRST